MSRSFKKKPISSVTKLGTNSGVQKAWKVACNKNIRRNILIEVPPGASYKKLSGDIWNSPSDGKSRLDPTNPKNYRK